MKMKKLIKLTRQDDFVSIALAVFMVLLLTATSNIFWSASNIQSLAYSVSRTAIVSFGMMLIMITGYFDLSVGNIMLLCSLSTAALIFVGVPSAAAALLGLLIGVAAGALNGFLVAICGINALIATVGTQYIFYGLAMRIWETAKQAKHLPEELCRISSDRFLGMEYYVWVALILLVVFTVYLRYTRSGRQLYYIGGNKEAARQMGYALKKKVFLAYAVMGLLGAVSGIFMMARIKNPSQNIGTDMHMTCIIACIVGGGSFAGGKGKATGALFGTIFISLLSNMFNLWEVKAMFQNFTLGLVLIAVLTLDGWLNIRRLRNLGKI